MISRYRTSPKLQGALKRSFKTISFRPKLKKPEPEARFPVEGVTYQFNDEAKPKRKRLLGFREWCERIYEPHRRSQRLNDVHLPK